MQFFISKSQNILAKMFKLWGKWEDVVSLKIKENHPRTQYKNEAKKQKVSSNCKNKCS